MMYYATHCYLCQWYRAITFFISLLHSYQHGDTALISAAKYYQAEIVRCLLDGGADISLRNNVSAYSVATLYYYLLGVMSSLLSITSLMFLFLFE